MSVDLSDNVLRSVKEESGSGSTQSLDLAHSRSNLTQIQQSDSCKTLYPEVYEVYMPLNKMENELAKGGLDARVPFHFLPKHSSKKQKDEPVTLPQPSTQQQFEKWKNEMDKKVSSERRKK